MLNRLTSAQRQVVITKRRKVVVKACPGSGKTYCVAARLVYKLKTWDSSHKGIAALSFTNVAWQEIRDTLRNAQGDAFTIRFPHFIGTIDSFINQFIFLPFGHCAIGCADRPRLVGEPYGRWTSKRSIYQKCFCDLVYDFDGNLQRRFPQLIGNDLWERDKTKFKNAKEGLLKAGIATQDDADYFALQILRKHPEVSKALAKRFPVLIIDEAQDTTDIQMAIIDCLLNAGLEEIMLVGDPDQAIFEWNDAKPELFKRKVNQWEANALELNQNRRSSRNICEFSHFLSSFESPSRSICYQDGNYKCDSRPQIISYTDVASALAHFKKCCEQSSLRLEKKSVLCRSRNAVADMLCSGASSTGSIQESPWNDGLEGDVVSYLAKGKYNFVNGDFVSGIHRCDKAIVMLGKKKSRVSNEEIKDVKIGIGVSEWRKNIYKLISNLPDVDLTIENWISRANIAISGLHPGNDFTTAFKPKMKDMVVRDIYAKYEPGSFIDDIEITTIHGAKGRTLDAVMVVLSSGYKAILKEAAKSVSTSMKPEKLRIVYVGITRPRKLLVLAVPETDLEAWKTFFCISETIDNGEVCSETPV
ncbi:MAG TPA: ATP-dependent helicase [Thermodesulfobacteriota bacterium]|jgi:hypothetical protein